MSALLPDKSLAIVIVAGGKSSRMGRDKTMLPWREGTVLTHQIWGAAQLGAECIVLSIHRHLTDAERALVDKYNVRVFYDEKQEGPLGAFRQVYESFRTDYYWFVAADMPSFQWYGSIDVKHVRDWSHRDSLIYVPTVAGKMQPFGSLYKRQGLAQGLNASNPKQSLMDLIRSVPHTCEEINSPHDRDYDNMNYPEDYAALYGRDQNRNRQVPVVTISASRSKTGKTTVVTQLIEAWQKRGKRVGFVKSDGHGFVMDKEDSDTGQATRVGAQAVAIVGPNGTAFINHEPPQDKRAALLSLSQMMNVDVVIIESRSQVIEPVIVVEREDYTVNRIHEDIQVARYISTREDMSELIDWIEHTLL